MPLLGGAGHAMGVLSLRQGTVGARFTVLYAVVFLISGTGLLGLTLLLGGVRLSSTSPAPNPVPPNNPASALARIRELEDELAAAHAEQSRQLLTAALVALILMVFISLVLGRVLARRVLRPLRLITGTTRRISADSLDQRLGVAGPTDEVKELADTIDELLARLEASFTAQRRFVANASHELRTPLATMRASLDVAAAKPEAAASTVALVDRLRPQLDRVDHLLDGLLVLARAQHGGFADAEVVDLRDLVAEALHDRHTDVVAKGLRVTVEMPSAATVQGRPALLARLVGNVVDNAVRHNEQDGWIEIAGSVDGGQAALVLETGGRILDQREVDRLAQPFERLGRERTGSSGLGLSIVAAVAAAHGGRLELFARPAGGLRAAITLPAALPAAKIRVSA
jgi:signal transduction histidine kinase